MDWLNPDTWKAPADLLEHWQAIAAAIVAIAGAIGAAFRWGSRPFVKLAAKIRGAGKPAAAVSERPLRFVQNEQQSFWGPATLGKEQGTQVAGHWTVTNTLHSPIVLLKARLDGYSASHVHVATEGTTGEYSSRAFIPARSIRQVVVQFSFFPVIASGFDPLFADVIFTDNFEDEHRVRSATFKSIVVPPRAQRPPRRAAAWSIEEIPDYEF
jgi:putative intracellular protease/amidase